MLPNPKKILYVITKSVWGGAQRYVYDLATHLPKDQFEVAVVCGGSGPLVEKLNAASVRVVSIPWLDRDINVLNELVSFWLLLALFLHERPDVIHLNSSKVGGLGAVAASVYKFLALNFKSLTVFTVHGWGFHEDRPHWQRSVIFFFSWLSTHFQQKIILIDTADYCAARRFIPARKLALIRHGILPAPFVHREAARNFFAGAISRPISRHTFLIGTIAELTANKGLTYLVDAASRLKQRPPNPELKFIIIGDGKERAGLQSRIGALGLGDTVFLAGFVPEASRYLTGFDAFALPSVKEGLPYVLLEAMSAGLPAIASSVGGVPDVIRDGVNGILVPPKDAAALAEAIAALATHPDRCRVLAESGYQTLGERFDFDAMMAETTALYQSR